MFVLEFTKKLRYIFYTHINQFPAIAIMIQLVWKILQVYDQFIYNNNNINFSVQVLLGIFIRIKKCFLLYKFQDHKTNKQLVTF